jgi:HPt (histidine-containing phosphotransfer) domain-containing protein
MSLESLQALDSVIDHDALLTRCLNKLDFAERMLTLFQGRCVEDMADLEQAFDQGDMGTVGKIAHRMAGACANAAAFGLQARATELRHATNDGGLEKISQCVAELQAEWDRFTTVVSASYKSPPQRAS